MIDEPVDEKAASAYARRVGERLRAIRKQKGLSLQEVEAASTQEFKASVLGAYERGERSISVPRLQRLARYYNVPVDQLLPRGEPRPPGHRLTVQDRVGRIARLRPEREHPPQVRQRVAQRGHLPVQDRHEPDVGCALELDHSRDVGTAPFNCGTSAWRVT